jgi:hypothetical protein
VKATLEPAIALPNAELEARGFGELLNQAYGTGRFSGSYRGHLISFHGGDINGFHSQIASLPQDGIGVIVLVIGDHAAPLYDIVTYDVFERLLGMSLTSWSERGLEIRKKQTLGLLFPGEPFQALIPWKPRKFPVKEFSDVVFEFVLVDGKVKELKQIDPSGEQRFPRK